MQVTLNEEGSLDFPEPYVTQCKTNPDVTASVYIYGYPSRGQWSTTGTGRFDDRRSTYTTYHASKLDLENGCLNLIFTTNDPKGPCGRVSGSMSVCFEDCGKSAQPVVANKSDLLHQKAALLLYPNPANNIITLKSDVFINHNNSYITSVAGKIISCNWHAGNANTLDISKLAPGMYFLHITYNKTITVLKFIKQ